MRIGLLAPPWIPIPPPAYGGIERVVALQAAGLAAAGHDVTLVAAPGSAIPGVEVVSSLDRLPAQIGMATDEWRTYSAAGELSITHDADTTLVIETPHGLRVSATASAQGQYAELNWGV